MKYPSRSEYYSAIRNPKFAFRKKDPVTQIERDLDSDLAIGKVVERVRANGMREAWSASGGFAIAFKYETPAQKLWAVRCFYRSGFEATQHYQKVTANLKKNTAYRAHFVSCQYLEEGIRVLGTCYPVVKMEWVEGESLKRFIKRNLDCRDRLQALAAQWQELSRNLLQGKLAHGDLQHGNILIADRRGGLELKLIDYDSLYFERDGNSIDDRVKGLPDYQHPLRESLKKQCLAIDFFPQLIIYTSILALSVKPQLWDTYNLEAREGLLFSKSDFQAPGRAPIFEALSRLSHPLPALSRSIETICRCQTFAQIPTLDTVLEATRATRSGFKPQSFVRRAPAARKPQNAGSFLSRLMGRGARLSEPPKPPSPAPESPEKASAPDVGARPQSDPAKAPPVEVEIVWNQPPASADAAVNRVPDSSAPSAADDTHQPASDRQPRATDSKLLWDPRAHKKATPTRSPQPAITAPQAPPLESPPLPQETLPEKSQNGDPPFAWVARTEQAAIGAYGALKQNVAQLLTPRTWSTRAVATTVDRPATWCHRQRYKYPDKFHLGKQYRKDSEGMIYWTRSGIQQLRSLKKQEFSIPPSLLPTKAVGTLLGVPPEHVTKLKAKYKDEFVAGTHYFVDRRKRYHWTAAGVERLRSRLALQKPARSTPKVSSKKQQAKSKRPS